MKSTPVFTDSENWQYADVIADPTHGLSEHDMQAYACDLSAKVDAYGQPVKKVNPLLAAILVFIIGGMI